MLDTFIKQTKGKVVEDVVKEEDMEVEKTDKTQQLTKQKAEQVEEEVEKKVEEEEMKEEEVIPIQAPPPPVETTPSLGKPKASKKRKARSRK